MGSTQAAAAWSRIGARRLACLVLAAMACSAGCAVAPTPAPGATTLAPSSPAPSSPPDYVDFTGQWGGHGNVMNVAADGTFTMRQRTYAFCDENPPPCDSMGVDGVITSGAVAQGTLESVSGTLAEGKITNSTDTSLLPTGPVTFTLDTANNVIEALDRNWCGPSAPPGVCD
ncbi:hypothetical protein [Nonomuraea glycinis]|uniref:hypothetical protein n=1 Tax=Nonomuraea glycinis TaxID=2047744 RepID=UPI00339E8E86